MNWISIKDKEPEIGLIVIAYNREKVCVAKYIRENKEYSHEILFEKDIVKTITLSRWVNSFMALEDTPGGNMFLNSVTHWAPLPQPPNDKQ